MPPATNEANDKNTPLPPDLDPKSESDVSDDELDGELEDVKVDLNDDQGRKTKAARRALGPTEKYAPQGPRRWSDAKNLKAAVHYDCPCGRKCLRHIAAEEQGVIALYEFRHCFRQRVEASGAGGARDVLRRDLQCHYDEIEKRFTTSFVVGTNGRCCVESYAVATGISEGTYARARADVTRNRPEHAGRTQRRTAIETVARAELDAYVRHLKNGMERDKETGEHFHAPYDTHKSRWRIYYKERVRKGLPVHGSMALLADVWKTHTEIHAYRASGHDKCDTCAWLKAKIDGAVGETEKAALREQREEHDKFHRGERDYSDDFWLEAEQRPENLTMLILDAPTQNQLNIPTQVSSPLHPPPAPACACVQHSLGKIEPACVHVVSGEAVSGRSEALPFPAKVRGEAHGRL